MDWVKLSGGWFGCWAWGVRGGGGGGGGWSGGGGGRRRYSVVRLWCVCMERGGGGEGWVGLCCVGLCWCWVAPALVSSPTDSSQPPTGQQSEIESRGRGHSRSSGPQAASRRGGCKQDGMGQVGGTVVGAGGGAVLLRLRVGGEGGGGSLCRWLGFCCGLRSRLGG